MAFSYTNRKGKTYYLHARPTKKGGTRYVFTTKVGEGALDEVPDGYEVYESVANAQVYLRKVPHHLITDQELAMARETLERLGLQLHRVDRKDEALTIYEPAGGDLSGLEDLHASLLGERRAREAIVKHARRTQYAPVLRFILDEEAPRTFHVERMTYRREGGWSWSLDSGPLEELLDSYVPHLGQDSFFSLM